MDIAENNKVGIINDCGNYKDKMVKKSLFRTSNKVTGCLTPKARLIFTQLKKTFTKALIFQYFDSECYIWIKTDTLNYAISGV